MKRLFTVFALLLAFASVAYSQTGTWSGNIKVQGVELPLLFHLTQENPTMDSPDQGAKGIPIQVDRSSSGSISIKIPSIGASYQGLWLVKQIMGTFTQHGNSFPLTLVPGEPKRSRPQTPVAPFPYTTEDVSFANGDAVLKGTLVLPEGCSRKTPVLVMVTGSGLQNRDEELFDHKPFAVIADAFARAGIATLRYDDRGFGESSGDIINCTTEDLKNDALAGIRLLRGRFDRIGVIGHSEGGTIALLLAAQKQIDFAVTLAAGATSGLQLLIDQNRALLQQSGMAPDTVEAYCLSLEQVLLKTVQHYRPDISFPIETLLDSLPQAKILSAGLRQNLKAVARQVEQQPWMRHFITIDPIPEISKIRCPLLALGGDKDLQVVVHPNFNALRRHLPRNKRSRLITYPDLNHLFQTCQTGLPDEYGQIEETIAPAVLDDIVRWVLSLK